VAIGRTRRADLARFSTRSALPDGRGGTEQSARAFVAVERALLADEPI